MSETRDESTAPDRRAGVHRLALGACLVAAVALVVFWANADLGRWAYFGVFPALDRAFPDMAAVLAAGEAAAAGLDPYAVPSPFDPYGRPHVYGPGWLGLGALGLGVADTLWVGWLTVGLFLVGAVALFPLRRARDLVVPAACLLAPPLLLGFNRANNDMWIFLCVLAAAWLAGRRERAGGWAALVLIAVAAALKFYPAVMLIAAATLSGRLSVAVGRALVVGAVLALAVWAQLDLYRAALAVVPNDRTIHAYDAGYAVRLVVIAAQNFDLALWWGLIAGLIAAGAAVWAGRHAWAEFLPTRGRAAFLLVASTAAWVGCLAAGPSYAYRAVWLLPLVAWAAWPGRVERRGALVWVVMVIAMFWLNLPKGIYGEAFAGGDETAFFPLMNYAGAEHMLGLGSWVIGMWMLIGWALRRLRAERAGG